MTWYFCDEEVSSYFVLQWLATTFVLKGEQLRFGWERVRGYFYGGGDQSLG